MRNFPFSPAAVAVIETPRACALVNDGCRQVLCSSLHREALWQCPRPVRGVRTVRREGISLISRSGVQAMHGVALGRRGA